MNNNNSNNNNSNSNKNSHHQQQHHHHYNNEYSLFVGDLPDDCSDDELQRLFQSKFKSVKRVQSKYSDMRLNLF
jgi:RNA recognition motif-containing protein